MSYLQREKQVTTYDDHSAGPGWPDAKPSSWGWTFAYSLLLIILGVLALLHPIATGLATGVLFGTAVLVYGCAAILAGIYARTTAAHVADLLLGALALVVGLGALFGPFQGALSLAWVAGAWLLASGIIQALLAGRRSHRVPQLLLGIIDIALGGMLLMSGPAAALVFLAAAVGCSFLIRGAFFAILALKMRGIGDLFGLE